MNLCRTAPIVLPSPLNRSRAQARVNDTKGRRGDPAVSAAAVGGPSPAGVGGLAGVGALSTPSTTHNSLQSSGSVRGLGGVSRTPLGGAQFGSNHKVSRNGVSVQSSHTESMSPPRGVGAVVNGHSQVCYFVFPANGICAMGRRVLWLYQ